MNLGGPAGCPLAGARRLGGSAPWLLLTALFAASCATSEKASRPPTNGLEKSDARPGMCPPATAGIVVSFDKVAYFPARAPDSELERLCPAVDDTLYDAVGWQAQGHKFAFVGATLVAVHSGAQPDTVPGDEPDMWTASGDSVRLPDGHLLPKTLGEIRRLGKIALDDNEGGYDDWSGPSARSCRFPEILFNLDGTNMPKHLPDSARVTSIEINVRHRETMATFCRP